jgi:hypothetical protein
MTQVAAPQPCAPHPTCPTPAPHPCSPTPEPCTPHETYCQSQAHPCDHGGCDAGHPSAFIGVDLDVHVALDFGHDCGHPTFA